MSDDRTLLLDIYQSIGLITAQNQSIMSEQGRAADSRRATHDKIDEANQKIAVMQSQVADMRPKVEAVENINSKMDGIARTVASMKPTVDDMSSIRLKLALAAAIVGAIVGGALQLVWLAVSHLSAIGAFLRAH